jgi:hypothetical protein
LYPLSQADLFRCCVLLIYGGIYADIDVLLESNLDHAVDPNIGFMMSQDKPGRQMDRQMCLWNGFIAAAPGHPFLAKVVQTVTNNIRNRFTIVDIDQLFCPDPDVSLLHRADTLIITGPCIMGAVVNKVLGRNEQESFKAGELDLWDQRNLTSLERGTKFVIGVDNEPSRKFPGKTVILHENIYDMGSLRITRLDKNMVVAATNLPDSNDFKNQKRPPEHYSKLHVKPGQKGVYGLNGVYSDDVRANEELTFFVDLEGRTWQSAELLK